MAGGWCVWCLKIEIGRDTAGNATSPTRVGASEAGTGVRGSRDLGLFTIALIRTSGCLDSV